MTDRRVPLVDLGPSNSAVKARVLARIGETIDRGDFTNGSAVGDFETSFAQYVGSAHCVGLSSGLDALRFCLLASGLAAGSGVIVPAATFAATFEAVVQAGGVPVPVDVSDVDNNLDVEAARGAPDGVTHILPVHLYGQMADMRGIARLAADRGLKIVEDACQAHGARRDGLRPGESAQAAAFSFYPAKNLGAMGDAGALVTDDADLAEYARAMREHGETRKYHHRYVGYTARLDTVQAIVLVEKLRMLDEWNVLRVEAARFYTEALSGVDGLQLPVVLDGSEPAWHLYVVRTVERESLATFLAARGIQTGRHYPEPPHLSEAYRTLGFAAGDFPTAEALSREALSLPLYPGITESQLDWVSESVREFFRKDASSFAS